MTIEICRKLYKDLKEKTPESTRCTGERLDSYGKNPLFSYEAGGDKTIYPKGIQCRSVSG